MKTKTSFLTIHNARFLTYSDDFLTFDILGGVDLEQIERMICTLRVSYQDYPPMRSTLDLYNDTQTDKLTRSICDKWGAKLQDVSKSVHGLISELENYKLQRLKYPRLKSDDFTLTPDQQQNAKAFLKNPDLINQLTKTLNKKGILGEDENAVILFLSLCSYKFNNPFSVICLAKSGIGKSYILQKLSECMPPNAFSFHSKISANALYYFDSHQIDGKALFIEDLDWTTQMLQPLATLQTQGKLINTRATKDKDGMLHSTTFEVVAKLCLLACAYSEKNFEEISLPFLCLHLNHSHSQDIAVMEYQKRCKAGEIKFHEVNQAQELLKSVVATLQNVNIINPYATLINLPEDVAFPRKSLLLLLNFIEVITYFFQFQRPQHIDQETGEISIITQPQDIELAFKLLKNNLFRRADELSTSARGFYNWLEKYLNEAKTKQFTALDVRKTRSVHPRTLNRYLQELKLFSYIQIIGGNKHREGFIYKLTQYGNQNNTQNNIEQSIKNTLQAVKNAFENEQATDEPKEELQTAQPEPTQEQKQTDEPTAQTEPTKEKQRIRINDREEHTFKLLMELEQQNQGREYTADDFTALTGRNYTTEARHLKTLFEQGKLSREWRNRQYYYTLKPDFMTFSKTVSQNPKSDPKTQAQ